MEDRGGKKSPSNCRCLVKSHWSDTSSISEWKLPFAGCPDTAPPVDANSSGQGRGCIYSRFIVWGGFGDVHQRGVRGVWDTLALSEKSALQKTLMHTIWINMSRLARMILHKISFFWIKKMWDLRLAFNLLLRAENLVSTRYLLRYRTQSKWSVIFFRYFT